MLVFIIINITTAIKKKHIFILLLQCEDTNSGTNVMKVKLKQLIKGLQGNFAKK